VKISLIGIKRAKYIRDTYTNTFKVTVFGF
jgi:hypothetical protein